MRDRHELSAAERKQRKLRWVLFGLLTPFSVFLCGQLAMTLQVPAEPAEVRSDLSADYSPWNAAFFPGLDPRILVEALRDGEGEGWLDTRRAMNCFLMTRSCETATPGALEVVEHNLEVTPTALRIANEVEPDFDQPDGTGLQIEPGQEILIDLRSTPILVSGSEEKDLDLLIFTVQAPNFGIAAETIVISLALKPNGLWTPVYVGGDQTHGDTDAEIPYSEQSEGAGASQESAASSGDAYPQQSSGFSIDVDASLKQPGLYGWMKLATISNASEPVVVDAILVIADSN